MNVYEKDFAIVNSVLGIIAILLVTGLFVSERCRDDVEKSLATVEANNRELAERTENLKGRIREIQRRIGESANSVEKIRKDIAGSSEKAGEIGKGLSGLSVRIESSIGKAGTAEQIVDECIRIVEKIEKGEQD